MGSSYRSLPGKMLDRRFERLDKAISYNGYRIRPPRAVFRDFAISPSLV